MNTARYTAVIQSLIGGKPLVDSFTHGPQTSLNVSRRGRLDAEEGPFYGEVRRLLHTIRAKHPAKKHPVKFVAAFSYQVTLFEIVSAVTAQDCIVFLSLHESLFVGWKGLVVVQHLAPQLFPVSSARIIALEDPSRPIVGRGGRNVAVMLQHTSEHVWMPSTIDPTTGLLHPGMQLLAVRRIHTD